MTNPTNMIQTLAKSIGIPPISHPIGLSVLKCRRLFRYQSTLMFSSVIWFGQKQKPLWHLFDCNCCLNNIAIAQLTGVFHWLKYSFTEAVPAQTFPSSEFARLHLHLVQSSSDYATPLVLTGMKRRRRRSWWWSWWCGGGRGRGGEWRWLCNPTLAWPAVGPTSPPGDPVKDHPSGSRLLQGGKVGRRPRMCER